MNYELKKLGLKKLGLKKIGLKGWQPLRPTL